MNNSCCCHGCNNTQASTAKRKNVILIFGYDTTHGHLDFVDMVLNVKKLESLVVMEPVTLSKLVCLQQWHPRFKLACFGSALARHPLCPSGRRSQEQRGHSWNELERERSELREEQCVELPRLPPDVPAKW